MSRRGIYKRCDVMCKCQIELLSDSRDARADEATTCQD